MDSGESKAPVSTRDLLRDTRMPRSDWSIGDMLAIELIGHLERMRPQRILEVGSGFSTAILAAYAAEYGAQVVTLEHKLEYHLRTLSGLKHLGLESFVDLRLARLTEQTFGGKGPYRWYNASLQGGFDFVFVDGPPKVMGRQGVFFAVEGHLRPGWRMLLDDGLRKHEQRCLKLWGHHFPGRFSCSRLDLGRDSKGVFVLSDAEYERDRRDDEPASREAGTGSLRSAHSDWWRRVQSNVGEKLLDSIHVVVATRADGGPSKKRFRKLLKELARRPDVRYVLYLDDRWSPCTIDETWLQRALDILEGQPDVEQVSLLHQIELTETNGSRPSADTPSLLRVEHRRRMPSRGIEVRLRLSGVRLTADYSKLPLRTVQLWPGVFRRTDDGADGSAMGHPWAGLLKDKTTNARQPAGALTRTAPMASLLALVSSSSTRIGLLLIGFGLGLLNGGLGERRGARSGLQPDGPQMA